MNSRVKISFKTIFLIIQILMVLVLLSFHPVLAQQQYQYPTLSVNPSTVVMYTPVTTITFTITSVTGLNALHFTFSFNNQGSTFLSLSNTDVSLGNLFTGQTPKLSTNIYYLSSTGRSYFNAVVEMPGNTGVSSTTTKNVLTINLHLLSTAIAGLQSDLKVEEADALFTSGQYIDEAGGLNLQSGLLTVGYLTTTMTATSMTITAGNAVTLTSTLQDVSGNPLSGMSVNYYIGSQSVGTALTDASGISGLAYTPSTAGTYTINALFVGNKTGGTFASSNATATLTVNPQNIPPTTKATALSLNVPSTATAGASTTIQATLTQSSSPLPNANIIFSSSLSGGSTSSIGSATTTSNGVATVSYAFPAAGTYSVIAKFLGDTTNLASDTAANVVVSQKSLVSTTLSLNVQSTAKVNQQVTISSTLKDSSQQPISGETIDYTAVANGIKQTIGSAKTDSDGFSSIPFVPLQAQTYQIEVNYGGSTIYSPSDDSKNLSANALMGNKTSTTITLTLSSNKVNTQTFVTISASLSAGQNGGPLAQENIVYQSSIDGVTWTNITTVATSGDGIAQTSYKPMQTGTLVIQALFDGDANYYSSASNQATLSVSNETTNSNIPWIWISIIIAIVVLVVVAIAVTKLRNRHNSLQSSKPD